MTYDPTALQKATEWLTKEPATDWGEVEWMMFNLCELTESLLVYYEYGDVDESEGFTDD